MIILSTLSFRYLETFFYHGFHFNALTFLIKYTCTIISSTHYFLLLLSIYSRKNGNKWTSYLNMYGCFVCLTFSITSISGKVFQTFLSLSLPPDVSHNFIIGAVMETWDDTKRRGADCCTAQMNLPISTYKGSLVDCYRISLESDCVFSANRPYAYVLIMHGRLMSRKSPSQNDNQMYFHIV